MALNSFLFCTTEIYFMHNCLRAIDIGQDVLENINKTL